MKLGDIIKKSRINLNLHSNDKNSVIEEMANLLKNDGIVNDINGFIGDIKAREEIMSTAIDKYVAIPHAKSKYVNEVGIALGISKNGIDYESSDGLVSKIFFMIAVPESGENTHIEILKELSSLLLDEAFKEKLLNVKTIDEAYNLITKEEQKEENNIKSDNFVVAVTACPTGIAHTFMAAEALQKAAKDMNVEIKVETNGTDGRKNEITKEDLKRAKGVILAVNRNVDETRFDGCRVIKVDAKEGINNAHKLIERTLNEEGNIFHAKHTSTEEVKTDKKGLYKHLMSGVSYMLPLVISGGILIALAFLIDSLSGHSNAGSDYGQATILAKTFKDIGGAAFGLFVPILGGYIAFSISERAALTAGLVAGAIAATGGSGFLGAILGGIFAGYSIKFLEKSLVGLPKTLNGIKLILFYPVLSVLLTGLAMILILNPVVSVVNNALFSFLESMSGSSKIVLGMLLGGMMAVDMGGPVNKAAYLFASGTLAETIQTGGSSVMAATMAGGMVPPLAIALSTTIFKNKYSKEEREAGISNYIMGLSFITEGAIPFAAANPFRVIPALVVGSAISGSLTMFFDIKIPAPHGGILVMFLSNNFLLYLTCIFVGSIVGALLLGILKKK